MNITLSIDKQLVERAREMLRATGKSLNQEIREHLQHITGAGSVEKAIERLGGAFPSGKSRRSGSGIAKSFTRTASVGPGKRSGIS